MPWLLRDEEVLAALEVASTPGERMRGLLGRDGIEGALFIEGVRSVHTVGMRFAIDVAFCDRDMVVLRMACMRPGRVSRVVMRSRGVLEAEAGAFERWRLRVGDRLEVRSG